MDKITEIAQEIASESTNNNKSVAFHYAVLTNADYLRGFDSIEFCRAVGMPDSYKTEFRKMIKLAEYIGQRGMTISTK